MSTQNSNARWANSRTIPRISVNKLGEYLAEPNPSRRQRILRDQKQPKDYILPYYDPARKAILRFFKEGGKPEVLLEELAKLEAASPASKWSENRNRSCSQALRHFIDSFVDTLDHDSLYAIPVKKNDPSYLIVEGVRITIRPDLLIYGEDQRRNNVAGAVKLYFPRSHPLNNDSGAYIATLVHRLVKEQMADKDVRASRKHCLVLDVFSGEHYIAPSSFKRRHQAIAAACNEIAALWSYI